MPAPIIYRSSDTSAPVLTGQAGALVALLDACLVTGYGSKAAAGWTKPYTSTSAAVFRPGAGTQLYVQVNDNGPGAGTFKEARAWGFETMSAYNTGTNMFPTGNGVFVRKSATADATARAWLLVADDRTFTLFIKTGDDASGYLGFHFGDFVTTAASDPYRCMIAARGTENSATVSVGTETFAAQGGWGGQAGHYTPRNHAASFGPIQVSKEGDTWGGIATALAGPMVYPNGADLGIYITPIYISEHGDGCLRGVMRGHYMGLHPTGSMADGDTFDGTGAYTGKSFLVVSPLGSSAGGYMVLETTAWATTL